MKELSIEEKAKRYEEAIKRARTEYKNHEAFKGFCEMLVNIFPELAESEDERIRKSILEHIQLCSESIPNRDIWIAWLEKQGEQKPIDKVEPKFKVGDWVVYNRNDHSREVIQIYDIRDNRYYFNDNIHFSWSVKECDEKSHLWTIEDAKEGDVLYSPEHRLLWIYKNQGEYHGAINLNYMNDVSINDVIVVPYDACPAIKIQRNFLFQKMKEKGYQWNENKKRLIRL